MKKTLVSFALCIGLSAFSVAAQTESAVLDALTNYRVDGPSMMSSGQPDERQFVALKALGVMNVIDLIPGDRGTEPELVEALGLHYYHIPVEWEHPTLENFQQYVIYMDSLATGEGKTLTHCRLNWRGAVFTYLYRVTQRQMPEAEARQAMLDVWQPNETWRQFIAEVLAHYSISMSTPVSLLPQ